MKKQDSLIKDWYKTKACTCPDCQYMQNALYTPNQAMYPLHTPKSLGETMRLLPFMSNPKNPMNGPYCSMRAVGHLLARFDKDPVLTHLQVCTVKEGNGLNTSVTLGFAKALAVHDLFEKHVIVLNMGTGAPKFQVYERVRTGGVRVTTEVKSKGGAQISPSSVAFEGFVPIKEEDKQPTQMDFVNGNKQWFDGCMDKLSMKLIKPLSELWSIPVFAVVTGTVRAHYWKGKENRPAMDIQMCEMLRLMTSDRVQHMNGTSFFIPQSDEGKYEFSALEEVVQSVDQNVVLILGLGIGKGSTQLSYRSCCG